MKSRQLARLHPPGRRENPFLPREEALLRHSCFKGLLLIPLGSRGMALAVLHPPGAPQGAEELTACFSNPRKLLVPGAEVARAGHTGQLCQGSHAGRQGWNQLPSRCSGVILGKWVLSAPQAAPAAPTPGQGHPEVGTTPPFAWAGQNPAPLPQ